MVEAGPLRSVRPIRRGEPRPVLVRAMAAWKEGALETPARAFVGYSLPTTPDALFAAVAAAARRPVVAVGFLHADSAGALVLPQGGARVELATLYARAAAARVTVWVLGCPIEDATCLDAARRVLGDATAAGASGAVELGRALVRARDRGDARALSVHGVARTGGAARLVHSRL